jgi:hypothetical protein
MSRINKLLLRFLSFPTDFTFRELCKLLRHFGFRLSNAGATSGSRVEFVSKRGESIKVHRPHGREIVVLSSLRHVHAELERFGYL